MNGCTGILAANYSYLVSNGRKDEANDILCELGWLVRANPVIECYIPVGTLISDPAVDACGVTETVVAITPIDPDLPLFITVPNLFLNGNPIVVAGTYSTFLFALDAVMAALGIATGTIWTYTQISLYQFLICSDYTRNGDVVVIDFVFTQEYQLGGIAIHIALAGGSQPDTPEYQTEEMSCLTAAEIEEMKLYRDTICNNVCLLPMATIPVDKNCN